MKSLLTTVFSNFLFIEKVSYCQGKRHPTILILVAILLKNMNTHYKFYNENWRYKYSIRTFTAPTKTQCIDYCDAMMSQPLQIFTTHTYRTV